jgi:hypothetical protein
MAAAPSGFVPLGVRRRLVVDVLSGLELGAWDEWMVNWLVASWLRGGVESLVVRREALVRREARRIEGGGRPSRRAVAAAW